MISNGGGASKLVFIQKINPTNSTNITCNAGAIANYDYILVVFSCGKEGGTGRQIGIQLNNITTASYGNHRIEGTTTTNGSGQTMIIITNNLTYNETIAGQIVISRKVTIGSGGSNYKFGVAGSSMASNNAASWGGFCSTGASTDTVSRIDLVSVTDNFSNNSEMAVYGILTS